MSEEILEQQSEEELEEQQAVAESSDEEVVEAKAKSEEMEDEKEAEEEMEESFDIPKTKAGMVKAIYDQINSMKKADLSDSFGKIMGSTSAEEDHMDDDDEDGDGGDFLLTFNKFGNNTANFLVGEKQIIVNDDGTTSYVVATYDDEELGIDNVPYDNAFTIFFDYNIDFDLDAIFIDDDESANTLNFYIQENDSN